MSYPINLLLLPMILVFAGCSITPRQPAMHDFGINQTEPVHKSLTQADITIDAPIWLRDNRIRYRLLYAKPTQVRFYTLDRWIAPPAEILEQQLESLGKALNKPMIIKLLEFEQQFESPSQSKVLMRLSVEAYSADHKIELGAEQFRFERWTDTPDAPGAVTAFSELTRQAADRIQTWLSELSDQ